jgi:hypothetical protein
MKSMRATDDAAIIARRGIDSILVLMFIDREENNRNGVVGSRSWLFRQEAIGECYTACFTIFPIA